MGFFGTRTNLSFKSTFHKIFAVLSNYLSTMTSSYNTTMKFRKLTFSGAIQRFSNLFTMMPFHTRRIQFRINPCDSLILTSLILLMTGGCTNSFNFGFLDIFPWICYTSLGGIFQLWRYVLTMGCYCSFITDIINSDQ